MYETTTYEVLLKRMLDRVPEKMDRREGSVIRDTLSPTAIELQILYIELDVILREMYGDTASREHLVPRAIERGLAPYPATHAVLKGVFTPSSVDVTGRRFNIGTLNYVVISRIADGEYRVQCETPGTIGNRYLGQMLPIEYVEGLETAELTQLLVPGEDEEDTEDFRERYFDSFNESAFGGNVRDYLQKVNAIAGVGAAKVTRVWNLDLRPADMIPSAAVDAWYASVIGSAGADVRRWLETVYTAAKEKKLTVGGTVLLTILTSEYGVPTAELVGTVQETIDPEVNAGEGYGLAPIGHVVNVRAAEEVKIAVTANITFGPGFSWGNLQDSMNAAVESYLLQLRRTWADESSLIVRIAQIETRILALSGVVDISGTKVNGSEGNLVLGPYEVPVFQSIGGGEGG